eukprot:9197258-Pyramimonas_sp.AAC.1
MPGGLASGQGTSSLLGKWVRGRLLVPLLALGSEGLPRQPLSNRSGRRGPPPPKKQKKRWLHVPRVVGETFSGFHFRDE